MSIEIERKFLVNKQLWDSLEKPEGDYFQQGYLYSDSTKTIRVRATTHTGYITIKGASTADGLSRSEYEYEIPKNEALQLLKEFAPTSLEKTRYRILIDGLYWEVDVFEGLNSGLLLAELELTDEHQPYRRPDWILEEVTGDTRYYNSYLAQHPFSTW